MPIRPNVLERILFFNLNVGPTPMLDLAGALAYQTVSTAVHLQLFETLAERPLSLTDLVEKLKCQERGLKFLMKALVGLGYLKEQNGRFQNTDMTTKWFLDKNGLDLKAAITCWDAFLKELWPHAPEIVQSGKRPFNFYNFSTSTPGLSHAHQQMMAGNATLNASDITKKVALPAEATHLLDVGGGHGVYAIRFCQAYPNLRATIFDSAAALETAKIHVEEAGLNGRIDLKPADIWETSWGTGHDIILLFNFIHHYDLGTNIRLLEKTFAALKPGGQVAIFDQIEGRVFGSATSTLLQLVGFMYYLFADGRIFSQDEVKQMLTENGFCDIQFFTSPKWAGQSLATAVKA